MGTSTTVTKVQLIERVAGLTGVKSRVARKIVNALVDEMIAELSKGRRLEFRDFGVLEVRLRQGRIAQNPRTLAPIPVPARRWVKFRAGGRLRRGLEDGAGLAGSVAAGNGVRAEARTVVRKRAVAAAVGGGSPALNGDARGR